MSDFVKVVQPSSASSAEALIVPAADGIFVFTMEAKHAGNNHGTPAMWGEIFINDRSDKKSAEVGWNDGPASMQLATAEFLEKGKDYTIRAVSGNRNADARGVSLTIQRAA